MPYSITWYDSSGVLSQNSNLSLSLPGPYHHTIFVEITDNSICVPMLDSVKIWYYDSCSIAIQSSHPGQVPASVPVTYTLQHSCPTTALNNRWLINGSLYTQNTNQLVYTWNTIGQQQVNAMVVHPCGYLTTGIGVDVVTGIGEANLQSHLQLIPFENRTWKITGEQLPANLTLRILDMRGQLAGQHHLAPEGGHLNHTLNLHHLSKGLYLIDITSDNGFRFTEKIVCW